jgi:hypothetical protein
LHDGITAERLGIPAMAVMTTRFVSAAELMARVLGFPGYRFAIIAHPISSAGDDALRDMAVAATIQVRDLLLGGSADRSTLDALSDEALRTDMTGPSNLNG